MSIKTIMNPNVVTIIQNGSLTEAAALMRNHHVGDLIVVESDSQNTIPVGILTDRDIVMEVIAKNIPYDSITVGDIMNTDLMTAKEDDGLWNTLQRMRYRGVKRVPVLNRQGILAGILSLDEALLLIAGELTAIAKTAQKEVDREKDIRE